jgi:hypothetical protein
MSGVRRVEETAFGSRESRNSNFMRKGFGPLDHRGINTVDLA